MITYILFQRLDSLDETFSVNIVISEILQESYLYIM